MIGTSSLLWAAAACNPWLLPHQQTRAFAAAKGKQQSKQSGKGGKGGKAGAGKKGALPAKKPKQRLERAALDEKDPFMARVIGMVIAGPSRRASASGGAKPKGGDAAAAAAAEEEDAALAEEAARRAKAYSGLQMAAHKAWRADLHAKLRLKRAALRALPPALRAPALVEDLEPFPLTRNFLFDTPPESYRS